MNILKHFQNNFQAIFSWYWINQQISIEKFVGFCFEALSGCLLLLTEPRRVSAAAKCLSTLWLWRCVRRNEKTTFWLWLSHVLRPTDRMTLSEPSARVRGSCSQRSVKYPERLSHAVNCLINSQFWQVSFFSAAIIFWESHPMKARNWS